MARKKRGDVVNGWVCLDKPFEMGSTEAVSKIRRISSSWVISTASTTSTTAVQFSFGLSKVSIRNALAVTLRAWNAATTIISENAVTPIDEPIGRPPRWSVP